jgi:hypothetical protein
MAKKRSIGKSFLIVVFGSILGTLLLIGISELFSLNNDKDEDKFDTSKISNLSTFKTYAKNVAESICQENTKIQNLNNTENRNLEELKLLSHETDCRNYLSKIAIEKDFPDNYLLEAEKTYDKVLIDCGYINEYR